MQDQINPPLGTLNFDGIHGDAIPLVEEPATKDTQKCKIYLLSSDSEAKECRFWVGVYREGSMTPAELVQQKKFSDILTTAVTKGIACKEHLTLAHSEDGQANVLYLAPIQNEKVVDCEIWLDSLTQAICNWAPEAPGFYLAPELLGSDLAGKLLMRILKPLILKNQFTNFYLFTGSHGLHTVLNLALKLRSKMQEEDRDVLVFH
ncbi:MAG: hypothetical protein HYW48_06370 [Deltaproteobacteria bacterium]|nr:hypothetical protein [Deltaproteobacteria bacterium]